MGFIKTVNNFIAASKTTVQYFNMVEGGSCFTQETIYDEEGYPWAEPIIYICAKQVQRLAFKYLATCPEVKAIVIAHEQGHAMSYYEGNILSKWDEEVLAWQYAEQYFYKKGNWKLFIKIREWGLNSYRT